MKYTSYAFFTSAVILRFCAFKIQLCNTHRHWHQLERLQLLLTAARYIQGCIAMETSHSLEGIWVHTIRQVFLQHFATLHLINRLSYFAVVMRIQKSVLCYSFDFTIQCTFCCGVCKICSLQYYFDFYRMVILVPLEGRSCERGGTGLPTESLPL